MALAGTTVEVKVEVKVRLALREVVAAARSIRGAAGVTSSGVTSRKRSGGRVVIVEERAEDTNLEENKMMEIS